LAKSETGNRGFLRRVEKRGKREFGKKIGGNGKGDPAGGRK